MSNEGEGNRGVDKAEMERLMTSALDRLREVIAPYSSAGRSLMIAHGAAILASLQFLKDAQPGSLRTNVSTLGAVLCVGFALAVIGYIFIVGATNDLLARPWEKSDGRNAIIPFRIGSIMLTLSALCLIFPVMGLAFKLWHGEL